jgi:ABC-2 type transport system ATP-binding protein
LIVLNDICKTFNVSRRGSGFAAAVKNLIRRKAETVEALKNITFTISDGEMVGYIGPNGAGKSTTIKIMCGILTPDSGSCIIDGRTPWRNRIEHVRDIGVVFGQRSQLWWDVPVADSFELIRDIYKVGTTEYARTLDELTTLLDLSELLKTPTRSLSLGQRMRCELAASLLHSPKILFLDEPTIGLDAVSKIAVRQFIKKLNAERGTTVILTTHDMQDIEALTERILLIGKGRILLDSNFQELKKLASKKKTIVFEYTGAITALPEGLTILEQKDGRVAVEFDPTVCAVSEVISQVSSQVEVLDISVYDIGAEEMVAGLYREYSI